MMQNPQQPQPQAPQSVPPAYAQPPAQQQPVYQQQSAQPQYAPQPSAASSKPKKGWPFLIFALIAWHVGRFGMELGYYLGVDTPLGGTVVGELVGALFVIIPCCIFGGTKMLDITKESWKFAWRALWVSIAISAGIALLDFYATVDAGQLILVSDWPWRAFLSVVFCICIGLFEEFMVRGLVLNGLLARMGTNRKGIVWACILSSVYFGLLHVDLSLPSILSATPLEFLQAVLKVIQTGMYGFALAAVVCKTGELISASLLHGFDDWLLFILTFVLGDTLETQYVSSGAEEGWSIVTIYVICIVLYIPLVVRAAKTLNAIDAPNRGAFFRPGLADLRYAPTPAGYAAPTPAGYTPPQPAAPVAQAAPVNLIPTQVPESSLYQTGQGGVPGAQIPQGPQTFR